MINIESGYSIVNQLTYDIVNQLIKDHQLYAIEEKKNHKQIVKEDLINWRTYGGKLLRC